MSPIPAREGKDILTAELKANTVKEFMEEMKTIGETEAKGFAADIRERDASIMIEIFSDRR